MGDWIYKLKNEFKTRSNTHKTCTGSNQMVSQHRDGEMDMGSQSYPRS